MKNSRRLLLLAAILLLPARPISSAGDAPHPDVVLHGTVRGNQDHTYIEVPFDVPAGVRRLTVSFKYTGKEQHTALDLGIEDPVRFRGWSGGNKDTFTISASDATPSYLPGEIVAGRWKLLIGIPNIRPNTVSSYEADVYFVRRGAPSGFAAFSVVPLGIGPAWYRGDLHMHTGHSDGRCASQSGSEVPCPVFVTLEAATRRGLDFVAITDHNTISQFDAMRELQPYFDKLLLIPGREITTFYGHANVFGITQFIDFRVGSKQVPDTNALLRDAVQMGGLVSINHPNAPTGEICMGCGWTPRGGFDPSLLSAIEAVNGGAEEGPYSGVSFWEKELNAGYRLTAIGGSDNHRPDTPLDRVGSVGSPTTVVYAPELSVDGILGGIKAGHAFIDLTGSRDRLLELTASLAGKTAMMGDSIDAAAGANVRLAIHVAASLGSDVRFTLDGRASPALANAAISTANQTLAFSWTSDGKRHWLRADVLARDGKLQLLGNPIYFNYPQHGPTVANP